MMRIAGVSSRSSGCLSNASMPRGTRGPRASVGFAEELAHRGVVRLGGVCVERYRRAVSGDRRAARSSSNKRLAAAASAPASSSGTSDARVPDGKRGRRALHRHHGELPGERIEHLDRESAFGSPGHPGSDRLRRGQAGAPVPRRGGTSEWNRRHAALAQAPGGGGVGFRRATRSARPGCARKIARASMSVSQP